MNPSIWELETFYRKGDILIIGAGFTGLWSAISIKEKFPEKSVLVVEKSSVPIGASTRNAFCLFRKFDGNHCRFRKNGLGKNVGSGENAF